MGGGGGTKHGGPLSRFGLGGGAGSPVVEGGRGALRLGVMEGTAVVSMFDVVTDTLLSDPVGEVACRTRETARRVIESFTLVGMKSHDIVLSIEDCV